MPIYIQYVCTIINMIRQHTATSSSRGARFRSLLVLYGGPMRARMEDLEHSKLLEWACSRGITDTPLAPSSSTCSMCACGGLGFSLRIASFPLAGGRGLAAVRALQEGELILRVPDAALMSLRSARGDTVLAQALCKHPRLSSVQILTVHLLRETSKKEESKWYSYLQHLPRVHHTLAHFSDDEAEALQVEEAVWAAKQAAIQARQSWLEAQGVLKDLKLQSKFQSLKAWLWAAATISSRTLHVPWDEAGTLCPVGDLFNYAPPGARVPGRASQGDGSLITCSGCECQNQAGTDVSTCSCIGDYESGGEDDGGGLELKDRLRDGGYEDGCHAFCFYARQHYKKGEQVLLCYGQYDNIELLEHYGFLLPDNPNNNVHIPLPLPSEFGTDRNTSWLPTVQPGDLYLGVDGRPSFSLLSALRLLAAPPVLRRARSHLAMSGMQISPQSDLAVYQWLKKKCQALLANLPTDVQQDKQFLRVISNSERDDPVGSCVCPAEQELSKLHLLQHRGRTEVERWKLAVVWRLGYKEVLLACVAHCGRKLCVLQRQLA